MPTSAGLAHQNRQHKSCGENELSQEMDFGVPTLACTRAPPRQLKPRLGTAVLQSQLLFSHIVMAKTIPAVPTQGWDRPPVQSFHFTPDTHNPFCTDPGFPAKTRRSSLRASRKE